MPLTDADRTRWRDTGWWWPLVVGGLAALVLLCVWWLVAQLRRQRRAEVVVDSGDGVGALLRGCALAEAVAAEVEALPGVVWARVTVVGRRRDQPRVRVVARLEPRAVPADTVRRVHAEAVEHARASAGLATLPAEVRLRAARRAPDRVG